MSDFLVELGANPRARQVIQTLGIPLPLPQTLRRSSVPWEDRPLDGLSVAVCHPPGSALGVAIATTLARAGASPLVDGAEALPAYAEAGEAWGHPPKALGEDTPKVHALVIDGTAIRSVEALRVLYTFVQPRIRALARCGRLVVLGRPPREATDVAGAAALRALEGFVRSAAKEVGRGGATANLVTVATGAEDLLEPVLRFLLSSRSAYVTGQPLHVGATASAAKPRWTRPLDGKVALVTGAARGIGAETARVLAREGAKVVVLDRPADDAPASLVADSIGGTLVLCDVTDADAPARIAEAIRERHGRLDIIVHNAGVTRDKTLAKMDAGRWDMTLGVNLDAVIRLTDALLPLVPEQGRVVALSSIAGIAGNFGQTNYAASKAGVIGFVQALAPILAERGVTVNAIAPGFIETRLTAAIPAATREVARRLAALAQGGLPVDIAEAVTFLASPGASGLTGQVLRVCGGSFVGA